MSDINYLLAVSTATLASGFAGLILPQIVIYNTAFFPARTKRRIAKTICGGLLISILIYSLIDRATQINQDSLFAFLLVILCMSSWTCWIFTDYFQRHPRLSLDSYQIALAIPLASAVLSGGLAIKILLPKPLVALLAIVLAVTVFLWILCRFFIPQSKRSVSAIVATLISLACGAPAFFTDFAAQPQPHSDQTAKQSEAKIKHILMISVDTLRFDAASGATQPLPTIRRLANESIEFTQARVPAPWTLPSVASIMTGVSPQTHTTTKLSQQLPETFLTLAEAFQAAGYKTAAIGNNPVLRAESGMAQGFQHYDFFPRFQKWNHLGIRLVRWLSPEKFRKNANSRELTDRAISWMQNNSDQNFFFWLHYYDPHLPYSPPREHLQETPPPNGPRWKWNKPFGTRAGAEKLSSEQRKWLRELYDAELRYVDQEIGRLLDELSALNLYQETLIVFTSDHGEEFWEHGFYEHGHSLYDELLRVPLLFKLPNSPRTGKVHTPVSINSIYPTVLEICELDDPRNLLESNSLTTAWESPKEYITKPIMSSSLLYYEDRVAVIIDGFKYIRWQISGKEELYDLNSDPTEQHSVIRRYPNRVQTARAAIKQHQEDTATLRSQLQLDHTTTAPIDEQVLEQLRAVGYVQ